MKIDVLGKVLEYDFFDADLLEKYEAANQKVKDDIQEKSQYEGKSTADAIRIQCGIVNKFFDEVFGEGTADMIFDGKNNIKTHMEAFSAIAEAVMSCRGELEEITDKYSPNRAERRAEQKKQNKQNVANFQRNAAQQNKGKHRHN